MACCVRDEHDETVASALLLMLATGLGDAFTPEVRDAWAAVYWTLADATKDGAAEPLARSAKGAGSASNLPIKSGFPCSFLTSRLSGDVNQLEERVWPSVVFFDPGVDNHLPTVHRVFLPGSQSLWLGRHQGARYV